MNNLYVDVPNYVSDTEGYKGAMKIGNDYCVVFKHGEDDFSYWITDDITDGSSGGSCRGNIEEVFEELKDTKFIKATELIK